MGRYQRHLEALSYEQFVKETFDALVTTHGDRVHLNRRMRGRRSGHEHQIDILIEATVAGLEILILVECKHYKNRVEVGDVLEFAQRIDDIGAHKGVVVSTVGFHDGAVKVARAHGIALITTLPVWRHVLYSRSKDEIHAFTVREMYLGGDSNDDFLIGLTVEAMSHSINIHPELPRGWRAIVEYLLADTDPQRLQVHLEQSLQEQFSPVCPFCGGQLRTPRARQCRHCRKDWHDLDNICERQGASNQVLQTDRASRGG